MTRPLSLRSTQPCAPFRAPREHWQRPAKGADLRFGRTRYAKSFKIVYAALMSGVVGAGDSAEKERT